MLLLLTVVFSLNKISFDAGVVSSPNYPDDYPNNIEKTETIQVEKGLIVSLQFTAFDIQHHHTCLYDHLTITDGDGTPLMERNCEEGLPPAITSTSNIVKVLFVTNAEDTAPGWSFSWIAATPGECQQ